MEWLLAAKSDANWPRAATRGALLAVAFVAVLAAVPSVGWAATVQAGNGVVTFTAAKGEDNRVQGRQHGSYFEFRDDGAPLEAGPGCEEIGDVVRCEGWGWGLQVRLLDGDDQAHVEHFSVDAIIWGGGGNDDIYGGSGAGSTAVHGEAGNDNLRTSNNGGPAEVTGGSGHDALRIGEGSFGYYAGGSGNDTITFIQLGSELTFPAAATMATTAALETVIDGGSGADALYYSGNGTWIDAEQWHFEEVNLWGGFGIQGSRRDDRLRAAGGQTSIFALRGDDFIDVQNGSPSDSVDCGPGRDEVLADPGDSVATNCERQL